MASGMITLSPVLFMQWVRMVFGPMPQWFCWFLSLWRNCPTQCTLMFLDALVLFRVTINFDSKTLTIFKNTSFFQFYFIFVFKGIIPIDEDFLAMVCYISIPLWCLLYGLVFMIIPGKYPINYYMCTGQDPIIDPYTASKYPINGIVPLSSLLLFVGLNWKISRYKKQVALPALQNHAQVVVGPCLQLPNLMQKTSISYIAVMVKVFFFKK